MLKRDDKFRVWFSNPASVKGQEILRSMLVVLVLNLVMGSAVSNVDNWGHVRTAG